MAAEDGSSSFRSRKAGDQPGLRSTIVRASGSRYFWATRCTSSAVTLLTRRKYSSSGGSTWAQISCAFGQRVRNGQPEGGTYAYAALTDYQAVYEG